MPASPAQVRPVVLDVLLAAALVVAVVVETLGNTAAPDPWVRAALAGVGVAAVGVRRVLPALAATALSGAITLESLTTEAPDETAVLLACVLVSWSVGVHAPRREALLGAALMSLGVSVAIATDPSDSVSNVAPTVLLFVLLPFGIGVMVRQRTQAVAALTLEAEALAREADHAVDAERRRIARELHDVVSHAVTLIAVRAEAGAAVLDTDPEEARRSLDAIGDVSREALAELHRLLGLLHDEDAVPEQGLDRLPTLVAGVRAAGLDVEVRAEGDGPPLPPSADHCAYRVLQEGLTNALRHAPDSRVRVVVTRDATGVHLAVDSRGTRHTSAYGGTGRGLAGLRERVLAAGGTFAAEADGPHGYAIAAHLPAAESP